MSVNPDIEQKYKDFLQALQLIFRYESYDHCLVGAFGEVYAEAKLGMIKAPAGEKAIDGTLPNGRTVQVKGKKPEYRRELNTLFIHISDKNHGLVDDVLVVIYDWDNEDWYHIGPVELKKVPYSKHRNGKRYTIQNIIKSGISNKIISKCNVRITDVKILPRKIEIQSNCSGLQYFMEYFPTFTNITAVFDKENKAIFVNARKIESFIRETDFGFDNIALKAIKGKKSLSYSFELENVTYGHDRWDTNIDKIVKVFAHLDKTFMKYLKNV